MQPKHLITLILKGKDRFCGPRQKSAEAVHGQQLFLHSFPGRQCTGLI